MKKNLGIIGEFLGHLVMGVIFFSLLVFASLLISTLTSWVGGFEAGKDLVPVLKLLEHVILYSDGVFLGWWTIYSTYHASKALLA